MNEQDKFWSGNFGNSYIKRNNEKLVKNNIQFFKKIFKNKKKTSIRTILEVGSNIGNNLIALKKVLKKNKLSLTAIEINSSACDILRKRIKKIEIKQNSIVNLKIEKKFDLVLLKGVLIHIDPKNLKKVYKLINNCAKKYVLIAEYYNPVPIRLNYRGYRNKLFKRDFAGEILKKYKNFTLNDYGFIYHKDKFPQDDITWFLLKKKNVS